MEFNHIVPHDGDMDGQTEGGEEHRPSPDPPIWAEFCNFLLFIIIYLTFNVYLCCGFLYIFMQIMRFFTNPGKPMILALARPDPKKNLMNLVKAFGECRPLRELANLTLIMGNRENIDEMLSTSASMLLSIIKMADKCDLYGQVAYPKHHK
ncbi:putative sucrose-phosphate synthase [Helianthus anomalus]